jgi:hypothetical protein
VLHWDQVAAGAIPPATPVERQGAQRLRDTPRHVCPSALGQGVHLFCDLPDHLALEDLRMVPFSSGVDLHSCAPVYRDVHALVQALPEPAELDSRR